MNSLSPTVLMCTLRLCNERSDPLPKTLKKRFLAVAMPQDKHLGGER